MFVRILIVLLSLALDYLSLSSIYLAVNSEYEVGNEYIQATTEERRQPHPTHKDRTSKSNGVKWFVHLNHNSNRSDCDLDEEPYQEGIASWYGPGFHGRPMANGKKYDMQAATVAHKTLPLGTRVCIKNIINDRVVVATVTDRGPYIGARIIDLSKGVARALDIEHKGLGTVEIHVIS